ncbi:hypothetical protein N7486_002097 [Penicillium sp. IBT 16267x]|nr:hypothetical protein N7486_002097 [Penicillium sp. IBT 16267x]
METGGARRRHAGVGLTLPDDNTRTGRAASRAVFIRPLIVDVLPPTLSPTILAIDGGGVRGVIPLEFLLLIQEHLGPCAIQDVVDLAVGTSSECSERFETLARRIFRERRPSLFLRRVAGSQSLIGQMARWVQWLIHDSCYDSRIFDSALKSAFGEYRRIFGATREDPPGPRRSGPRVGVVTTSISRDTNTFVVGNFNISQDATEDAGNGCTFGIGSFQDGGLKHNFAGDIATQISRQIWPRAIGSTRLVTLGTGKAELSDHTPHFRHIFRDSFLRRGFDAWMSTMDTDSDWRKWKARLPDSVRVDCHRLDVSLGNSPHTIDAIETMEDYRNLVILQVGSARMAREAATSLLVSRFFFTMDSLPENTTVPFWCYGSVHYKGPAQKIVKALNLLYPQGLSYVSDCGLINDIGGLDSLCVSCGRYSRSISFLTRHLDYTVNLYIQAPSRIRWRIGGFPETVASFVSKQDLDSPFGQEDHGHPYRQPCHNCDATGSPPKGKRRRSESGSLVDVGPKKRAQVT